MHGLYFNGYELLLEVCIYYHTQALLPIMSLQVDNNHLSF